MGKAILKGWRFAGFVGAIVGAIGITIYPIIIRFKDYKYWYYALQVFISSPYLYPEKWKKLSKEIREEAGIKPENIQPGNMKVWSDPFDRPGKPGNKWTTTANKWKDTNID